MADFDPDAYLGSAPSGGGGFDPDTYLGTKPAEKAAPEGRNFFTPRTGGEELATKPHDTSIYGTAIPKRADTFSGRVQENFGHAWEKVKEAAKGAYGADRDLRQFDPAGPVKTAGNLLSLANEAAGLVTAIPHAAVDPTVEKYTGIPGEEVSGALGAAGARGLRAPIAGRPPEPPRPSAPSVLSPEFRAGQEAAVNPPPPTEGPQGPTVAQPRTGLEPDVRLLPPDLPVGQPVRDSVGAARAQTALEQANPAAVRILENMAREEGWTPGTLDQLEAEHSPHHFLGESSENFEGLTKGAQTLPGNARTEINQSVSQRHRERGERVNAIHDEYLGQDVDRTTWDAAMKTAAQRESAPFWQQFDRQVIAPTPEIEAVLQRPGMRRALAAANDTLLNRGLPIEQGFPFLGEEEAASFGDNAGRAAAERNAAQTRVPTARAFQLAKMQLDKRIADAVRGGHSTDIRTYTTLKHDLDTAIAAHPNQEIAQLWQQARQTYRGPMSLINAREIGEGLLGGKTHYTEVPGILEDMSPEQRAALQLGMRNHMADTAGRPGASAQLRNIREMLGPDNQRKIAAVIGEDRANAYVNALQQEEHMHFAPGRLTKGSDTAGNLAYQELIKSQVQPSALARGVGAVGKVARTIADPKGAVARAGMEALERGEDTRAARQLQDITTSLGRLLTTQGPERDAIRRALVQRVQEGEGGLAGPVGRQPLARKITEEAGPTGRVRRREPLKINQFERDIGEGKEPTESSAILEAGVRKAGEPPRQVTPILSRQAEASGERLVEVKTKPFDDAWKKDKVFYVGANGAGETAFPGRYSRAQEYVANNDKMEVPSAGVQKNGSVGFTDGRHRFAVMRDMGHETIPVSMDEESISNARKQRILAEPQRQAMSFGDMKRRDFLKGIAATGIAAAKPEVITSALKRVGMGERLVDAAAPRALARQAIYSFGEDKAKALDYLYENAKNAKPGGPIEKAYRAAVRHITSGDIDKEPSIWAKSVAELRKHDDTIRAAQTARRAAEQLPGRGEVPETAGPKLEAPEAAELPASEETKAGLRRNVIKRGRTGRPIQTEPLREEHARGGRIAAPLSARKKYSYAHNRGTEKEHCSNCSMFIKPHSCTAVGGFIAKMGKCDIWEAARKRRAEGGSIDDSDLEDIPTRSERFLADIDRSRYANGGSLFDPTPMANNPRQSSMPGNMMSQMNRAPPNPPAGLGAPSGIMTQPNPPAGLGQPPTMQADSMMQPATSALPGAGPQVGPASGMMAGLFGNVGGPKPYKHGGAVEPTDSQKKAGNYKKRHIAVHGLDISIENEKGSTRSGKDKGGKPWSVKMPYHYGYIRRAEGADGDHVDVCLGPHLKSDKVFVVNQHDAETKRFDEHKVFIGWGSEAQARAHYKRGFSDGKGHERLGSMREMTVEKFKDWLKNGDTSAPMKRAA